MVERRAVEWGSGRGRHVRPDGRAGAGPHHGRDLRRRARHDPDRFRGDAGPLDGQGNQALAAGPRQAEAAVGTGGDALRQARRDRVGQYLARQPQRRLELAGLPRPQDRGQVLARRGRHVAERHDSAGHWLPLQVEDTTPDGHVVGHQAQRQFTLVPPGD